MGFLALVETFRSLVVGFVTLGLLLFVLFAKGRLPVRLPGVLVAFLVGTALYYGLGLSGLGAPGFALPRAAALHVAISWPRSEEHTSELQSLMRISYAVFCLKNKKHSKRLKETVRLHVEETRTHTHTDTDHE